MEQGRARGIRGRLYPFVSFDSEGDQVALLGEWHIVFLGILIVCIAETDMKIVLLRLCCCWLLIVTPHD